MALGLAISTTLISYLGIFPAAWWLRRKRPTQELPYKAPILGVLTIVSLVWIVFCTVQLLFPGIGDGWFSANYRPDQWGASEKWTYLLTELIPLALFTAIALAFWTIGRREAGTGRIVDLRDVDVRESTGATTPASHDEVAARREG